MEQALPELLTRYDTFILDSSLTLISPSRGLLSRCGNNAFPSH